MPIVPEIMPTVIPSSLCSYCGCVKHDDWRMCPSIKAIEYYPDGALKRIEKHDPALTVRVDARGAKA